MNKPFKDLNQCFVHGHEEHFCNPRGFLCTVLQFKITMCWVKKLVYPNINIKHVYLIKTKNSLSNQKL